MLKKWTEVLPVFVVRWLAQKYCKDQCCNDTESIVAARPDIFIKL